MESAESNELKLLFIAEELSQHGEWLVDEFVSAIERRKLIRSSDLHDAIAYSAFRDGENPGLKVNFMGYGRAIEIQANKRNRHRVDTNKDVWGIKNRQKPKNTRWYAKNMYGGLGRLTSRVMYGLSDQEIERLKKILKNRKQQ